MSWEDEGFLLSKKKFRENAIIISAFTKTHGKISGIVYGGTSRKIKNYLQIGNRIFFIHSSKNRNKLGYLKTEIIENQKNYEKLIDEAANEISNFVDKANLENLS